MVNVEIGWVMIIVGFGFLVAESLYPGFFVAVPGTVLLVMGTVFLLLPEVFDQWNAVIMVITALIASIATIIMYRKIAPGQTPSCTSKDTLKNKIGKVTTDIEPGSISGKVKIDNQIWSATSESVIPRGKKVRVIESEGVHVRVVEISE